MRDVHDVDDHEVHGVDDGDRDNVEAAGDNDDHDDHNVAGNGNADVRGAHRHRPAPGGTVDRLA
jgi:hypothetical protein